MLPHGSYPSFFMIPGLGPGGCANPIRRPTNSDENALLVSGSQTGGDLKEAFSKARAVDNPPTGAPGGAPGRFSLGEYEACDGYLGELSGSNNTFRGKWAQFPGGEDAAKAKCTAIGDACTGITWRPDHPVNPNMYMLKAQTATPQNSCEHDVWTDPKWKSLVKSLSEAEKKRVAGALALSAAARAEKFSKRGAVAKEAAKKAEEKFQKEKANAHAAAVEKFDKRRLEEAADRAKRVEYFSKHQATAKAGSVAAREKFNKNQATAKGNRVEKFNKHRAAASDTSSSKKASGKRGAKRRKAAAKKRRKKTSKKKGAEVGSFLSVSREENAPPGSWTEDCSDRTEVFWRKWYFRWTLRISIFSRTRTIFVFPGPCSFIFKSYVLFRIRNIARRI